MFELSILRIANGPSARRIAALALAVLTTISGGVAIAQSHSGVRYRVERSHLEQLSEKGLEILVPYSEAVSEARRNEARARSAERNAVRRLDDAIAEAALADEDHELARARVRAARLTDDPSAVAEANAEQLVEREAARLADKRVRWLQAEVDRARAAVDHAESVVWLRETELELATAERLVKEGTRAGTGYRIGSFEDQTKRLRRSVERNMRVFEKERAKSSKRESSYRQELASLGGSDGAASGT